MTLPGAAAFGTMHGKEAAFAPPLTRLGVTLVRPEELTPTASAPSPEK